MRTTDMQNHAACKQDLAPPLKTGCCGFSNLDDGDIQVPEKFHFAVANIKQRGLVYSENQKQLPYTPSEFE
jgi:hypothetical protein